MAGQDFSFATDNNPYLQYRRELGSGGFGSVHEVLSWLVNETYIVRYTIFLGKKFECEIFMKLMVVIPEEIASYPFNRQGPGAERGAGN
jgi:hypothetical protein